MRINEIGKPFIDKLSNGWVKFNNVLIQKIIYFRKSILPTLSLYIHFSLDTISIIIMIYYLVISVWLLKIVYLHIIVLVYLYGKERYDEIKKINQDW